MRKFQALSLSAALLASLLLGGCANNAASSDAASSDSAASEPEATPEPTPAPPAANPLTGAADADYTGKRPVAVTLRNMTGSTPQWGIASADVLVEGVTEGTTASLMALYANPDSIAKAGPVGPARDLLLQVALPLNAVPVHIDKNIYASNLLNTLAYQDLDGYHIGKTAFAFDQDRQNAGYAEENCWYTTAELINSGLASYGVSLNGDNTPLFQFGERPAVDPADRSGMNLTITFSPDDIDCLNYDTGTGLYALSNGDGSPVQDADNGQREMYLGLPVTTAALFLPTVLGLARLLHGPLPILGTALLVVMALAFLSPFKLAKPRLPGMILMILMGCAELVIVFLGVKP